MQLATFQYRLKDSSCQFRLRQHGFAVNDVWNYCNEVAAYQWSFRRKILSAFDLHHLTTGTSKDLGLLAQTVQSVCDEYAKCGKQFKKPKLNWRSRKRSLGWIPFKGGGIKVVADTVKFCGHVFRFWSSRPLPGKVRCGSFNEDSQGRWYVNFVCEVQSSIRVKTGKSAGIDLGLKTLATLSDGVEFNRENLTRTFEIQLAASQRARKKKRSVAIHARVRNKRKDWAHKTTTLLAREYDVLIVGNVSASKLKQTKFAKSAADVGWYGFKQMLSYKAIALGTVYQEVNEAFSTITCSVCSEKTGPNGPSDLGVRVWTCSVCGTSHNRDVNAAQNILSSARGI